MANDIDWDAVPDDDIHETWWERLVGLKEAFSPGTRQFIANTASGGWDLAKKTFNRARNASWAVVAGVIVIFLPYVVLTEMDEMEREQEQHQQEILLGPSAAMVMGEEANAKND